MESNILYRSEMNPEKQTFVRAVLHLFQTYDEIKIHANKYNDVSIKILSYLGKKCRNSDLRNQKCLYKTWNDEIVRKEVKILFERRLGENTVNAETVPYIIEDETPEQTVVEDECPEQDIHDIDANGLAQPSENGTRDVNISNDKTDCEEILHLQSKLEVLEQINKSLTSDIALNLVAHKESINGFTAKVAALENSEKKHQQQLQNLVQQNEELKSDLKRECSNKEQYQLEKNRIEQLYLISLTQKDKKIDRLNAFIQKLNDNLKNEKSKLSQEIEKHVNLSDAHQKSLENNKQLIAEYQVRIKMFESMVVDLSARNRQVEENFILDSTKDNTLVTDLEKEIQNGIEHLTAAEKMKFQLKRELGHREKLIEELQTLSAELQSKFSKATEEIAVLRKQLNEFGHNADNREVRVTKLSEEQLSDSRINVSLPVEEFIEHPSKATSVYVERLTTSMEFKTNAVASIASQTTAVFADEYYLNKEMQVLKDQLAYLTVDNQTLKTTLKETQIALEKSKLINKELTVTKQLKVEIETLTTLISTKDEQLEQLKKINADLQMKFDDSFRNGNDVLGKVTQLELECGDLQHKVALLPQKCEQVQVSKVSITEYNPSNETHPTTAETFKTFISDKSNLLLSNKNKYMIRCICGIFRDDNEIVQCHKCLVWQHIECTGANINDRNYLCERCGERVVDLEIPLNEYTDEGYRYYLTLMRGDLQVHQTDTVYVLRDISITPESTSKKHTYKTIEKVDYNDCDIFRVEHLWKDKEENRFACGYHYVRPNETYYAPNRKFYKNEIIRVPVYEVFPIELIIGRCWVMDSTTFCKGRPVECEESHVYICDMKTDKSRRVLSKILRKQYLVCTKPYAFETFEEKLKISRDCTPHHSTKVKKKKTDDDSNPIPLKAPRMQY